MNKNDFPLILNNYFSKHLSLERKFSENTYTSYLNVLKQFIEYLEKIGENRKNIKITDFTKGNILNFLNYVENDLKCSIKTRNHKLTIINSFLEYAQSVNPTYLNAYLESKSIKLKKVPKKKMDYMTKDELKAFFKAINIKYKDEYRHYILFSILYETGARVSELINIKVEDCFFNGNHPYIKIYGKGFKERIVYINDSLLKMINEYLDKFNVKTGFLLRNHSGEQYSRFGINKLISKYYQIAKKECQTLERKTITPHTFRHSKAVHFLENGTALPIIQRFLGHSCIQTTEIYLDITNEVVIEAVELAADILQTEKQESVWNKDEKLIELLESMSK